MFRKSTKPDAAGGISSAMAQKIAILRKEHHAIVCAEAAQRTRAQFVGEVISTRIVPRGLSHWFEVVISDGTGKINGWFFGRKGIQGMELGSLVLFEGLVQLDQGELTIANPYYEFV